jgi:hypothetical protein
MAGPRMAVYESAVVVAEGVKRDEVDNEAEAESRSRMMVVSRCVFSVCLWGEGGKRGHDQPSP